MSETSKPEAWQRRVHIGLHHDIHFLRYAQQRVFADVPVRLGNRTYRAWGTAKLTLMVRFAAYSPKFGFPHAETQFCFTVRMLYICDLHS